MPITIDCSTKINFKNVPKNRFFSHHKAIHGNNLPTLPQSAISLVSDYYRYMLVYYC